MKRTIGSLILFSLAALVLSGSSCPGENKPDAYPEVCITSPTGGEVPIGEVTIEATIYDDHGIEYTVMYVDNTYKGGHDSYDGDTYTYTWNSSDMESGSEHTISITASDTKEQNTSDEVTVTMGEAVEEEGTLHEDDISSDETWLASENPHQIKAEINVSNGATVTIEAGCTVKSIIGGGIVVSEGSVTALGTLSSPILFTAAESSMPQDEWSGFYFRGENSTGTFTYCTIEYAGGGASGAILLNDSAEVNLSHCTIRESYTDGIHARNGGNLGDGFTGNTITGCGSYPVDISAEYVHQLNNDNTYTGNTIDAIKIDHGYVTGTVTWRNLPVPYHVVSLVYCGADDLIGVLIIEPGTTLMMDYNAQFAIGSQARGGFIADGTSEQIKFISLQDTPAHGDWGNIYFLWDADDDSCIIKNCKLEYGGRQVDGIIRIRDALPTIVDDSIGYSGAYGIFLQRETPDPQELEDNNTFYNNTSGNVYGP